jgi:hypothetical protein
MSERQPLDRAEVIARVGEARARHQQRPMVVRVATSAVGFVLLLAAVALFWFPEVGLPIALVALRLLALEFDWAVTAQAWLLMKWAQLRGWYAKQSLLGKFAWAAVLAIVLVALIVGIAGG